MKKIKIVTYKIPNIETNIKNIGFLIIDTKLNNEDYYSKYSVYYPNLYLFKNKELFLLFITLFDIFGGHSLKKENKILKKLLNE